MNYLIQLVRVNADPKGILKEAQQGTQAASGIDQAAAAKLNALSRGARRR